MSSWVNRTVLSGASIAANGTNAHTCTFTAAGGGDLLIAVVAGAVTFTTPTGWALEGSAINDTGLYVFSKTASASESSFSTTHNGSNYAILGVVYEFFAGSAVIGNAGTDNNQSATATGPDTNSLTGTYSRFAVRSWNMTGTSSTAAAAWTLPSIEDYDTYVPNSGSTDGVALTIAYDDNVTGASFTPSSTYSITSSSAPDGQAVSFGLSLTAGMTTTLSWFKAT